MSWPGIELTERVQHKTGDTRMFWGREHKWTGSKWEPTEGRKKDGPAKARPRAKAAEPSKAPKEKPEAEPEKKAEPAKEPEEATILKKYKLKFTGPGHEKLAKAVEKGIDKAADLCKINPPVCKGNLGRSRDTMPQFPDDKVRDSFLEKMRKQGVRVTEGKMKVGHLKASQDEIQAKKTIGMAGSYLDGTFKGIKNAIVVSKDGYIVDGHHRWAALLTVSPGEEMNVIRVGVPIKPLLDMVNDHEGVVKRGLGAASIGAPKKEWYERVADLLEKLSSDDSRSLRRGDQVTVRTHRAVVKRQHPKHRMFTYEQFKGPAELTLPYQGFDSIAAQWAAEPPSGQTPSMLKSFKPRKKGSALKLQYKGETLLVPLDDVDERHEGGVQRLAASAELTGMFRLQEYGSPVVAEPRRSSAYSPKGGYRAPSTDRMADSRKRRKKSGREQPFIDPEDFTRTESYEAAGDELAELKAQPGDEFVTAGARRTWLKWLGDLERATKQTSGVDWGRSEFRQSKAGARLSGLLKDYCRGKVVVPESRYVALSDVLHGTLSEIVAPMPRGGRSGKLAFTAQPVGPGHGVGVSPSASPADMEAGRHQYVVDGPTIKKRKPGYKPPRVGAGSMGPTRAERS